VAKRVVVSVSLAPGFLYSTTTSYEGNGLRVATIDPPANSLLPLWSSWDIPGASNGVPGLVRLTFQARILPAVAPGLYNLTAAVRALCAACRRVQWRHAGHHVHREDQWGVARAARQRRFRQQQQCPDDRRVRPVARDRDVRLTVRTRLARPSVWENEGQCPGPSGS